MRIWQDWHLPPTKEELLVASAYIKWPGLSDRGSHLCRTNGSRKYHLCRDAPLEIGAFPHSPSLFQDNPRSNPACLAALRRCPPYMGSIGQPTQLILPMQDTSFWSFLQICSILVGEKPLFISPFLHNKIGHLKSQHMWSNRPSYTQDTPRS